MVRGDADDMPRLPAPEPGHFEQWTLLKIEVEARFLLDAPLQCRSIPAGGFELSEGYFL